jgi:hypothetical protein
MHEGVRSVLQFPEAQTERKPLKARPRPDFDRKELREAISKRYSTSLAYLGR